MKTAKQPAACAGKKRRTQAVAKQQNQPSPVPGWRTVWSKKREKWMFRHKLSGKRVASLAAVKRFEAEQETKNIVGIGRDVSKDSDMLILCDEVIRISRLMNSSGLSEGTSGNVSVRAPGGFLITPSGMAYDVLKASDIVFVDNRGGYYGELLPSSEWRLHYDIYNSKNDAEAVVHAHPDYCTALASLQQSIPAFHYMVAAAGGKDILCAPYHTFGSQELSNAVVDSMEGGRKACLMANHGMICYSNSLPKALGLAQTIEMLARQYMIALSVSKPVILDDQEMDTILAKFKTYGKQPEEIAAMGSFCSQHAVKPPPRRD